MQDNLKYYKNISNILKWKAKPSRDIQKTSRKNKPRCKIETKQQSSNKQKEIVNRPANKTVQQNPKHQMLYSEYFNRERPTSLKCHELPADRNLIVPAILETDPKLIVSWPENK